MTKTKNENSNSKTLETPPANPKIARAHFASRLAFETDPSDVYTDLRNGSDVIVLDTRSADSFARGHVPGAINLPYGQIDGATTASLSKDRLIITYCAGMFCNASTKAAERLSALGFRVKEMIDGFDGWKKEHLPIEETALSLSVPDSD